MSEAIEDAQKQRRYEWRRGAHTWPQQHLQPDDEAQRAYESSDDWQ
tara:strand:- start:547 stop:684 length:138 start_codon:yes stop_codon:yes gene_type:complete